MYKLCTQQAKGAEKALKAETVTQSLIELSSMGNLGKHFEELVVSCSS